MTGAEVSISIVTQTGEVFSWSTPGLERFWHHDEVKIALESDFRDGRKVSHPQDLAIDANEEPTAQLHYFLSSAPYPSLSATSIPVATHPEHMRMAQQVSALEQTSGEEQQSQQSMSQASQIKAATYMQPQQLPQQVMAPPQQSAPPLPCFPFMSQPIPGVLGGFGMGGMMGGITGIEHLLAPAYSTNAVVGYPQVQQQSDPLLQSSTLQASHPHTDAASTSVSEDEFIQSEGTKRKREDEDDASLISQSEKRVKTEEGTVHAQSIINLASDNPFLKLTLDQILPQ
eukprot:MONOS_16202.1-p1 / transcript=MONOS_16202.1 / gene=MONOS_16202 / organism=Monocercomonoides_exilis_PA203 / gene_product=unspecified product / transcript_product=unspecified product / location=Mono_scaffold01561:4263-5181(-) / protein_length=286 / sequence_SO=supercontig / SO=protein_coding / is_pseudo=false